MIRQNNKRPHAKDFRVARMLYNMLGAWARLAKEAGLVSERVYVSVIVSFQGLRVDACVCLHGPTFLRFLLSLESMIIDFAISEHPCMWVKKAHLGTR
jgi:hypothetical protein